MAKYELMLIFKPSLTESAIDAMLEKLKIKEKKRTNLGKRLLAYALKGEKEGNYLYLELELPSVNAQELSKKLEIEDNILRYLLIKV